MYNNFSDVWSTDTEADPDSPCVRRTAYGDRGMCKSEAPAANEKLSRPEAFHRLGKTGAVRIARRMQMLTLDVDTIAALCVHCETVPCFDVHDG